MVTFFIIGIVLFISQFVVGMLWYSVFFKKIFMKLVNIDFSSITKEEMVLTYRKQALLSIVRAFSAAAIIMLLPAFDFQSILILVMMIVLLPLGVIESNLWVKSKKPKLIWLDVFYNQFNFFVMCVFGSGIKILFN